jgi:hypothetical protein
MSRLWPALLLFLPSLALPAQSALDQAACDRLKAAKVMGAGAPVDCARLAIVRFPYVDFSGAKRNDGEIMVLAAAAPEVRQLLDELYRRRFPLTHAHLMEHYGGDDAAAMADNNTSGFNHRPITGGGPPSLHAYGLAIDINPMQNPYVDIEAEGVARYSPPAGIRYANRLATRPGKPARTGMAEEVVSLFARHGFTVWGGYWDAPLDYQHFQVERKLAEQLAMLPEAKARQLFMRHVEQQRRRLLPASNSTKLDSDKTRMPRNW